MFGKIKEKQLEDEKRYRELKGKNKDELTVSEMVFMGNYDRERELLTKKERRKAILKSNSYIKFNYYFNSFVKYTCLFGLLLTLIFVFCSIFIEGKRFEEIFLKATFFCVLFAFCYFSFSFFTEMEFKRTEKYLNPYYSSLNSNNSKKETTDVSVSDTDDNADSSSKSDTGHLSIPKINPDVKDVKNISSVDDSTDDIIKMMKGNLLEIDQYYKLSKRQAGWAFVSAIVSFFAGFVFLGVVIWILLNKSTDTLALIIPAIGTVVSELFGLTIFSVYKKSLNQLNSYYDSLHDNERFISLLYITDKLSDPKQRDELFTQIVKDQISTINRQKTKAEEQNAKKPSGKKVVLVKKNKKNNSKNP